MELRSSKLAAFAFATFAGLVLAFATPLSLAQPSWLPKCFGVVTRISGGDWVLVCQNPCIGGGQGCTKHNGVPLGYTHTSQTCKCQGGAWDCCDIWYDMINGEVPAGYCGEQECPGSGTCQADEDPNGDVSASCQQSE